MLSGFAFGSRSGRDTVRRGFTLTELLIVLAVIVLLAAILIPSMSAAREHARDTACKSNLYRLSQVLHAGSGLAVPSPYGWVGTALARGAGGILRCPKDTSEGSAGSGGGVIGGGNIEQIAPPPSVRFDACESDTLIRTFPEAQGFVLPVDVTVNITQPGAYGNSYGTAGVIPAGTMVDCQFLFYDPVGGGPAQTSGSITMGGEILGIICLDGQLDATDAVLGLPGTTYATGQASRGFESGAEFVTLESDRRTLTIQQYSTTTAAEQVRILTVVGGGGSSSYAMNAQVNYASPRMDQLMLLEYKKTVAKFGQALPADNDVFSDWIAPRHFGRLNAALVNGSVSSYYPQEVQPDLNGNLWSVFWSAPAAPPNATALQGR